jgi:hypothetical protein
VPTEPSRPPGLEGRIFRTRDVLRAGLLSRRQLHGQAWRPLIRGVHADARLPVDHGTLCGAALLVCPRGTLLAGRSAAWVLGADLVTPLDPVDVIVPTRCDIAPRAGLLIRIGDVPATDTLRLDGFLLTGPERTAWDLARGDDVADAVTGLDVLLRRRIVDHNRLRRYAAGRSEPGAARARRAIVLADGRAESPPETRVRVALVLAGLPPPTPQVEVWLDGEFVARVDLGWPDRRVAVEYDGAGHADPGQMRRDRARLNRLLQAGWRVIHVTATDLSRLDRIVRLVRALLEI